MNCNHCYHVIWRNPNTGRHNRFCCHCGDDVIEMRTPAFECASKPIYTGPHGAFIHIRRPHDYWREAERDKS